MTLNAHPTYYDVLDLKPDASPHEIREAYLRTKATYNKDSAALYTLISAEERESMLRLIEEAHEILSNPEKRKEYDRYHGLISEELDFTRHSRPPTSKIISIDRVPPMEQPQGEGDELLVAPSTDFSEQGRSAFGGPGTPFDSGSGEVPSSMGPFSGPPQVSSPPPAMAKPQVAPVMINPFMESPAQQPDPEPRAPQPVSPARQKAMQQEAELQREIAIESEWTGLFLKRVREVRGVSIEDLSAATKINKGYIVAIEEENFLKLPAAVFVRGFLSQIARTLKLPAENLITAYLARFNSSGAKKTR